MLAHQIPILAMQVSLQRLALDIADRQWNRFQRHLCTISGELACASSAKRCD
jgi:hypothetical protein